jgi:flagellar protein FlaF
MGFATAGGTAVIAVGLLVCFAVVYPPVESTVERVSEARDAAAEQRLDRRNTDVAVGNVTWTDDASGPGGSLAVEVTNAGSTTLAVEGTDLLADGRYVADTSATVDGEPRAVWVPGETLRLEASLPSGPPDRVKVVVDDGIARTLTGVV